MPLLDVINLSTGYNGLEVINSVSISINPGECVSILGRNGSGKTTILSCISGLIKPTSGNILMDEVDIGEFMPNKIAELGLALVPEARRIFSEHTVLENLELGAYIQLRNKNKNNFNKQLKKILSLFPILEQRLNSSAGELSGGQQQMLAIARAMIRNPKVLLLDEPSLGLAPKIINEIYKVFEHLKKTGVTILIAEQAVDAALSISDKVIILQQGKVVLSGTPSELSSNQSFFGTYLG